MTAAIPPLVIGLKTLTLVLGGAITYFAAKAAIRAGGRDLAALAIGFGVITLGSLAAGIADQALDIPHGQALILENALTTLGFGIIAYSLAATRGLAGGT